MQLLNLQFNENLLRRLRENDASLTGITILCFEDEEILQLCNALKTNTNLRYLWINTGAVSGLYHRITDVSAKALAKVPTLLELRLSWAEIGDEGARAFALNTTLTGLGLSYNKITESGAQAFLHNTNLSILLINANKISYSTEKMIEKNINLRSDLSKELALACKSNNLNRVSELLAKGVRPYGQWVSIATNTACGDTLLHLAVRQKNITLLNILLPDNLDINTRNGEGLTYSELARQLGVSLIQEEKKAIYLPPSNNNLPVTRTAITTSVKSNVSTATHTPSYASQHNATHNLAKTAAPVAIQPQSIMPASFSSKISKEDYDVIKDTDKEYSNSSRLDLGQSSSERLGPQGKKESKISQSYIDSEQEKMIDSFSEDEIKNVISESFGVLVVGSASKSISQNSNTTLQSVKSSETKLPQVGTPTPETRLTPLENEFLTNPILKSHITLIANLSNDAIDALRILNDQNVDLNKVISSASQLEKNYEKFENRLLNIEKLHELDTQSQSEISDIQASKSLRIYYKTLKILLGQTFLASQVISSGAVDPTQSMQVTVINGIASVAGSLCPPAAPFLSFASMLIHTADNISSCKAMRNLSTWADLQTVVIFASLLARRFTQIQRDHMTQQITAQDKGWLKKFSQECETLFYAIKGESALPLEKQHAILDAKKIFAYMQQHLRPENTTEDECIDLLLEKITGNNAHQHLTQAKSVQQINMTTTNINVNNQAVVNVQQTTVTSFSNTTMSNNIVSTPAIASTIALQENATKDEVKELRKKMAQLEAEREAEQKIKREQEKLLQAMQQKLDELHKKTVSSNSRSSHDQDNGDGTVSLQRNTHVNTGQGMMPVEEAIRSLQRQLADLQGFAGTAAPILDDLQKQQQNSVRDAKDEEMQRAALFQGGSAYYQQAKK